MVGRRKVQALCISYSLNADREMKLVSAMDGGRFKDLATCGSLRARTYGSVACLSSPMQVEEGKVNEVRISVTSAKERFFL